MDPFVLAPYIHPHNTPKYHVSLVRAIEYAKKHDLAINWIIAWDKITSKSASAFPKAKLGEEKKTWLTFHDQKTSGIQDTFPCYKDLPVRVTQTLDRTNRMFKNS